MTQNIDIAHLAQLARLSLSEQQEQAALADLTNIINMINDMQAVDTENIEPMAHPMDATQRLRKDLVTETVDRQNFQSHAPKTDAGYYLVPRVVE